MLVLEALRTGKQERSQASKKSEVPALSSEEITTLLSRLIHLLEEDDADAIEVLDRLAPLFSEGEEAKQIQRVVACVERYEFDAALEKLNAIESLSIYREK